MMHHAMNQLCKVCGEPAAGFHFGAFTCEGCKSFFGRTYNNLSSLSECKNNGRCIINKKNRTSCKSCRLRKCLLVGMSKSGSRYGRRSNWFKIHCLLQDQAALHHATTHHPLDSSGINGFSAASKMGYESGSSDEHRSCQDDGVTTLKEERSVSPESRDSSCEDGARTTSNGNRLLSPYNASPSPPTFTKREGSSSNATTSSGSVGSPFLVHHQLPISPISPLSPLHPQTKFVFTPSGTCYLHTNGLAFPNAAKLSPYHPRPPPYSSMGDLYSKSTPKLILGELQEGTPPEQDDPIDLSIRGSSSRTPVRDANDEDDEESDKGMRKRRGGDEDDVSDVSEDEEETCESDGRQGRGLPLDLSTK